MGWKKQLTGVAVAASLAVMGGTAAAQSAASGSQHGQSATGTQEPGAQTSRPAADAKKFYKKAALGNMAEIELGKLGAQKAQDQEVKQFAQSMADAHQRALDELKQVASGNVEWPTALDEKRQKVHDELSALNGEEFDREFMDAIVDAHESIENLLEDYVGENRAGMDPAAATGTSSSAGATGTSGSDRPAAAASPRLSGAAYDWATKSLQEVRSHLEQAKDLRDQVKK